MHLLRIPAKANADSVRVAPGWAGSLAAVGPRPMGFLEPRAPPARGLETSRSGRTGTIELRCLGTGEPIRTPYDYCFSHSAEKVKGNLSRLVAG